MIRPCSPQVETATHTLTRSQPMTSDEFYGRIAANGAVSVASYPGYVDVYRDGQHVARWLQYPKVLWYAPKNGATPERTPEDPDTWPPPCLTCGGPMIVKWGGRPREPFWSCKKWDSPWPRSCEGRQPFTLHPEEMEAYQAYDPPDNPWWSPQANKAARQAAKRRKWAQLVEASLARLNGQSIDNSSTISRTVVQTENER
jgi:hypothetical protein